MPKSFELAPTDVNDLLTQVISEHHQRLEDIDLKVGVLMVFAPVDEETGIRKGTALTGHAGHPAAAQIKLVSIKDRLTKKYDVELLLDGDSWKELTDAKKVAILDHEMTHIVECDETDDIGRPKLKMREEDFIVWGFLEVVRRHGANAMECRSVRKLIDEHGSLLLGNVVAEVVDVARAKAPKPTPTASVEDDDEEEHDLDESEDDADAPVAPRSRKSRG